MDYTLKGAPRLRRDTDANWKAVNPVLADGEQIAIKMTDGSIRYKIGNGSSDYNSLKYFVDQNYIDSKETIRDSNSKKSISFSVDGIDGDNFVVEITGGGDSTSLVESFNGRSGDVVPQSGDYTASDVGAIPTSDKGKAGGVATLGSDGKVPTSQLPKMDYDAAGSAAAVQGKLDVHAGDATKHVTATERNAWNAKCGKAVAFTVTLSAVGWSENTQTVSDARFLTDGYAYSVAPDSGSFSAYGEAMIYADNVTTAGQMRFHCSEIPTTDLTVNILRIEVSV